MNPSSVESKENRRWVISRHPKCRHQMYYWMVAHLGNWFIWVNCLVFGVLCVVCVCFFFIVIWSISLMLCMFRSLCIMHMFFTSVRHCKRTRKWMNNQHLKHKNTSCSYWVTHFVQWQAIDALRLIFRSVFLRSHRRNRVPDRVVQVFEFTASNSYVKPNWLMSRFFPIEYSLEWNVAIRKYGK